MSATTYIPLRARPPRTTSRRLQVSARTLRHLWEEARPVVQLVFQLRFLTGMSFSTAVTRGRLEPDSLVATVGWLGVVLAVYLLNGVSDVAGDRVNGSARPLATGRLGVRTAQVATVLAGLGGLAACWSVNPRCGALAVAMLALGAVYSIGPRAAKNSPAGAALVCAGGGLLTFLAGATAAGGGLRDPEWVVAGLLSLWMGVAGGTKDFDDAQGDALAGRHTLPVRLGDRRARVVVAGGVFLLAVVAGGAACHFAAGEADVALPAAVLAVGGGAVAFRTLRPIRRRDAYRLFMATQWIAVLSALGATFVA
jgi:4-hydroxybenzoate polyprenyltransferase